MWYTYRMTTLQQTVEIPADHRLVLDLPVSLPRGFADITLRIRPKMQKHQKTFIESLGDLYGCLKDSETFSGDPMDIQKKMRDEWQFPFFRRKSVMDFYGCLKDSEAFSGDSMDSQRKMSDEWPE